MAMTGSFGPVPDEWRPKQQSIEMPHKGLHLLVLNVRVHRGTVASETLAVSFDRKLLEAAIARWLESPDNRAMYMDHTIRKKPLILE
jgi:hypothetical protein